MERTLENFREFCPSRVATMSQIRRWINDYEISGSALFRKMQRAGFGRANYKLRFGGRVETLVVRDYGDLPTLDGSWNDRFREMIAFNDKVLFG